MIVINRAAVLHARQLILTNKITYSDQWNAPEKPDNIEAKSIFYLGRHINEDENNKESLAFPISSDFKTINKAGCLAAYKRAAQNGYMEIANEAHHLYEMILNKESKANIIIFSNYRIIDNKIII